MMYGDWTEVLWNPQVSHFLNIPAPDVVASVEYRTHFLSSVATHQKNNLKNVLDQLWNTSLEGHQILLQHWKQTLFQIKRNNDAAEVHQLKIVKKNFFRISAMFQMKFSPATQDILQLRILALGWQCYSALLALSSYLPSRLLNQTVSLCFLCTTSVSPYLISPRLLPPNISPRFSPRTAWLLLPPALSQPEWFFFFPTVFMRRPFFLTQPSNHSELRRDRIPTSQILRQSSGSWGKFGGGD